MNVDLGSISRVLTLRYDPLQKPVRRPMKPADFVPKDIANPEDQIDLIASQVLHALYTRHNIRRVSLSLSGGVDSRLTLSWLKNFAPDVKVNCISVGFGEADDEISAAREVARLHNAAFTELILNDVLKDLPKLISIVRQPRWNLYQYYAFERGKKDSDFFFTGDGGDEMFGGYTFRYQKFLSNIPKSGGWKAKAKQYLDCHERDWVPDQDKVFGSAITFSWNMIYQLLKGSFDNGLDPLDQIFLADFNGKLLYDWLPVNIAYGRDLKMNIQSVLLSLPMIKFATHIPWRLKYDAVSNTGKLPLRKLLSKYEKRPVQNSKRGFSLNLVSMWDSYARKKVQDFVNEESEVVSNNIISKRWLKKTLQGLQEGSLEKNPRYINKMVSILALEVWYRLFVAKTMRPEQKL